MIDKFISDVLNQNYYEGVFPEIDESGIPFEFVTELHRKLIFISNMMGVTLSQESPQRDTMSGCYHPIEDIIKMDGDLFNRSRLGYLMVLAHELTHATGRSTRLARPVIGSFLIFDQYHRAQEETIAQLGAYRILEKFGCVNNDVYRALVMYVKGQLNYIGLFSDLFPEAHKETIIKEAWRETDKVMNYIDMIMGEESCAA